MLLDDQFESAKEHIEMAKERLQRMESPDPTALVLLDLDLVAPLLALGEDQEAANALSRVFFSVGSEDLSGISFVIQKLGSTANRFARLGFEQHSIPCLELGIELLGKQKEPESSESWAVNMEREYKLALARLLEAVDRRPEAKRWLSEVKEELLQDETSPVSSIWAEKVKDTFEAVYDEEGACSWLKECIRREQDAARVSSPSIAPSLLMLSDSLLGSYQASEARDFAEKARPLLNQYTGIDKSKVEADYFQLSGLSRLVLGETEEGINLLRRSVEFAQRTKGISQQGVMSYQLRLAHALAHNGELEDAEQIIDGGMNELYPIHRFSNSAGYASLLELKGEIARSRGELNASREHLQEAEKQSLRSSGGKPSYQSTAIQYQLGKTMRESGDHQSAIDLFERALAWLKKKELAETPLCMAVSQSLAGCLSTLGRNEEAAEHEERAKRIALDVNRRNDFLLFEPGSDFDFGL